MDSKRFATFVLAAGLALPAAAYNHVDTVAPTVQGPFNVACSNVAQDASRIGAGLNAPDYWEGRNHYVTELLTSPTAIRYDVRVPFDPLIYPGNFGRNVEFAAIVCYPTPKSNNDPNYTLPGTTDVVPHMQRTGEAPKLISAYEYNETLNGGGFIPTDPAVAMNLPLIMYSHGLGGSPISAGYLQAMALLASHGYMVAGVFHGDSRFSPIHVENVADALAFLAGYNLFVNMQLMRPLSLIALTDLLLGNPDWSRGINPQQIGGFGASMGGEAILHLMGAKITSTIGYTCSNTPTDSRIKVAVGYVPYAGQTFLPQFCDQQSGVDGINKPFLALSGTADTTAPIKMVDSALRRMKGPRYLVELEGVPHEFKAEYAGDLLTWMVTFFRAYLQNDAGAMTKFTRMNTVAGGPNDHLRLDVHVPTTQTSGSQRVVEFRNTILNHYFMTIDQENINLLLSGYYGPGWEMTGQSFKGWTVPNMALDVAQQVRVAPDGVCRFYGGYVQGGPNSHFYTASPDECDRVKSGFYGPWGYEGIGFYSQVAIGNKCPAGFMGVNRAYNNRWWANDSNHRFSTSDSTIRDLVAEGWTYEGMVMCTPP